MTVLPLLDQNIELSYTALGAQLSQIESPYFAIIQAIQQESPQALTIGIRGKIANLKKKAFKFVKKYWLKILNVVCPWWNKNKEKDGENLVARVASVIIPILPPPYNLLQGLAVLIAIIIIKQGLKKICTRRSTAPSPPKILE